MTVETLANGTPVAVSQSIRFGQDALLLSRFCAPRRAEAACDLGTGCGVIALDWYDRGHRGPCLALDINGEAVALVERAARLCGARGIRAVRGDLRDGALLAPWAQTFDVVACNPPYFTGGPVSPDGARAGARHTLTCTVEDAARAAFCLLRDGGRFALCQRPERLADVLCAMRAARVEPKRLQFVSAGPDRAPWLFLAEGRKNRAPGLTLLPTQIVSRRGT